jgi:sensor domain CHASE-containing protein
LAQILSNKLNQRASLLPALLVGGAVMLAALLLWQAVLRGEQAHIRQSVDLQAAGIGERILDQMRSRMLTLQRMAALG